MTIIKKLYFLLLGVLLLLILLPKAGYNQKQIKNHKFFPILKGPYLGQKPPGLTPSIFAPGIISTDESEMCIWFAPGGTELYLTRRKNSRGIIFFMKEENGRWTSPQVTSFSGEYNDGDFSLSYDGKKLLFNSLRPGDKKNKTIGSWDIWMVERTASGWSEPINPGAPINSEKREFFPTFSTNGDLFFASDRDGDSDIYISKFVNHDFNKPIKLSSSINSDYDEWDQVIAPDCGYMLFCSNRPDSYSSSDLYISYYRKDGQWTKAQNMGAVINTSHDIYCPSISPDGKYIFFRSQKSGNGDIYWMDAKIIKKLR